MDASGSDFRACNTYCRSGPCVPTHTAIRPWHSSFTCIILSWYNTFVLNGVALSLLQWKKRIKSSWQWNKIVCSLRTVYNLLCSIPQNRVEGYVKNGFKLKALFCPIAAFWIVAAIAQREPLPSTKEKAPAPTKSSICSQCLAITWGKYELGLILKQNATAQLRSGSLLQCQLSSSKAP